MHAWYWTDKTVAVAIENFGTWLKYIKYELPEPKIATTEEGIITSYENANILTMNASNVILNNKKNCGLW